MKIRIEPPLAERFPSLQVLICRVRGLKVRKETHELQVFREKVCEETRHRYDIETVKDVSVFRAYRDFFWRVGIDPTKVRPAAEALIRRILSGKTIPTINTLVDSYNLASVQTCLAMAAFDADRLRGDLAMRLADAGEKFFGIGMSEAIELGGNEIVVSDDEKLVAVYPYRDADSTKATLATKDVCVLICGVPGIGVDILTEASSVAVDYITRFCGGVGGLET